MGMSRLVLLTWSKSVAWPPNYMALFSKGEVLWSPSKGARISLPAVFIWCGVFCFFFFCVCVKARRLIAS